MLNMQMWLGSKLFLTDWLKLSWFPCIYWHNSFWYFYSHNDDAMTGTRFPYYTPLWRKSVGHLFIPTTEPIIRTLGLYSLGKRSLRGIEIPIINLRRSDDRPRFMMVIAILIRRRLLRPRCALYCYIEQLWNMQFRGQGPILRRLFHRNSNSMETSFCPHPSCSEVIAMKFCTAVFFFADSIQCNGITLKIIFHNIWITVEKSFVKWAPRRKSETPYPLCDIIIRILKAHAQTV